MRIKNKKTEKEYDITTAQWNSDFKDKDLQRLYTVVSSVDKKGSIDKIVPPEALEASQSKAGTGTAPGK